MIPPKHARFPQYSLVIIYLCLFMLKLQSAKIKKKKLREKKCFCFAYKINF